MDAMAKTYKCALSGENLGKEQAFRFVLSSEDVICFDIDFKLQGKDVVVSSITSLIPAWLNAEFFSKNFQVQVDLEKIKAQVLRQFHHKILTFIALAKKSGRVQLGKKQVECALRHIRSDDFLLIQATDSSEREKFKNDKYKIVEIFSSLELSSFLGKEKLYYLLVTGNFASTILELAETYKILKSINDR